MMNLTDLEQVDGARHVVLIIPQRLGHTLTHSLECGEVYDTSDSVLTVAVSVKHLKRLKNENENYLRNLTFFTTILSLRSAS